MKPARTPTPPEPVEIQDEPGMAERFRAHLTAPRADPSDQAAPAQQFREAEKHPQLKPLSFSQRQSLIGEIVAALIGLLQRELASLWHAHVMPEERLLNRYRRRSTNISGFGVFWTCSSKYQTPELLTHGNRLKKGARRRVSRVLSRPEALVLGRGWPFLWGARCRAPRATDPSGGAKVRPAFPRAGCLPLLLGLAPGGVFPAAAVAGGAVRSYRTVSPLPPPGVPGRTGGVLSVALSLGSPPPGVTRHRTSVEPGLSSLRPKAESGHPAVWH
jgi:hypothetical protein